MIDVKENVAIITGGAGAIGSVIAKVLNDSGIKVFITDINEERLSQVKEEIGVGCEFLTANICDVEACRNIAKECVKKFGRINYLINAAGIALRKPLLEVSKEEFMKLYEVNVFSNLAMTQACYEYMLKEEVKDIVSIVSSSGVYPHYHQGAYCSTKFAQKVLNEVLNVELFEEDIRVHNIYPSGVDTPMAKLAMGSSDSDKYCKPEEIAEIILFILQCRNNSVLDNVIIRRYSKRPDQM